jgi:branched-chain amino acid transport system substrate-binding protein
MKIKKTLYRHKGETVTNRSRKPWQRATPLFSIGIAGIVALSACTSSGSNPATGVGGSGGVTSSASGSASPDALGSPKVAAGDPISIGFVYDGVSDAADYTGLLTGAKAAVQYVNQYLGGIAGHPIKLDACSTQQNPAQAANCVTKLANDKVSAVLSAGSGWQTYTLPPIAKGGIPVFATEALDPAILNNPNIFVMSNNLASAYAGPAKVAQQAGYKRAAIVLVDVPAATGPFKENAPPYYDRANVKVDIVTVPPDAADMTPQIQAEVSKDPGQFYVVGGSAFCARAIQAIKSVSFKGNVVVIPQCVDATTVKTVGGVAGVKIVTATSDDPTTADFKRFAAVMGKYAGGEQLNSLSEEGYQIVAGFERGLTALTGTVSTASIASALKAMQSTPIPLGGGMNFKCDGLQVPSATSVCSTQTLLGTLAAKGGIDSKGYSVIEVTDLQK